MRETLKSEIVMERAHELDSATSNEVTYIMAIRYISRVVQTSDILVRRWVFD